MPAEWRSTQIYGEQRAIEVVMVVHRKLVNNERLSDAPWPVYVMGH